MTIAETLRRVILERGATPHELARRAGVAPSTLCRWLSGRRGLSLESAERLAGVLGLRLVSVGRARRAATEPRPPVSAMPLFADAETP